MHIQKENINIDMEQNSLLKKSLEFMESFLTDFHGIIHVS